MKLSISEAIIVEGKYDKNVLSQIVDAVIIDLSGFSIFNDREKLELIRRLAEKTGIVILTDSDGAGFLIRNHLKGSIDSGRVLHAYIPDIAGKERRKRKASSEGKLGVEGMSAEIILAAIRSSGATINGERNLFEKRICRSDLYQLGLFGGENSSGKRNMLKEILQLPRHISTSAMLDVINALYSPAEWEEIVKEALQEKPAEN